MMSSIQHASQWDVAIAYVRFVDKPKKGKARPVLLYELGASYLYAFKITSKEPSKEYEAIELSDWEGLGLLKPSWLQLEPLYIIQTVDLGPVIGHASDDLVSQVKELLGDG